MRWRFRSWPEGHHSNVTLELEQKPDGTELRLKQTGIPANSFEQTQDGWQNYYWKSIKQTFGFGAYFYWRVFSLIDNIQPPSFIFADLEFDSAKMSLLKIISYCIFHLLLMDCDIVLLSFIGKFDKLCALLQLISCCLFLCNGELCSASYTVKQISLSLIRLLIYYFRLHRMLQLCPYFWKPCEMAWLAMDPCLS